MGPHMFLKLLVNIWSEGESQKYLSLTVCFLAYFYLILSVCFLAYFLTELMSRDGQVQIWGEKVFCQLWIRCFDIPERYDQGVSFKITKPAELKWAQKVRLCLWAVCSDLVYNTQVLFWFRLGFGLVFSNRYRCNSWYSNFLRRVI